MKQPPCRCGYLSFPHRHSHWCDAWLAQQDEGDTVEEWDAEHLLDERDRARYVNELNRGVAK